MRFVAAARVPEVCTDLGARKFLVVGAPNGPLAPVGLRRRIDDAVEGELAARGALPAAIGVDAELSSCIRDQVFRTRALGSTGLAIALPPLSELADAEGRLNVDDSAALLAWTRATAELPVVLLTSEADRQVSAYAPMPLERLLAAEGRAAPEAPPPAVDEATWMEASREPASDPFDMTPPPAAVSPAREEARRRDDVRRTPQPPPAGRSRVTPVPPAVASRDPEAGIAAAARHAEPPCDDAPRAEIDIALAARMTVAAGPAGAAPGMDLALLAASAEPANGAGAGAGAGAGGAPRRLKSGVLKGTRRGPRPDARLDGRPAEPRDARDPRDASEAHALRDAHDLHDARYAAEPHAHGAPEAHAHDARYAAEAHAHDAHDACAPMDPEAPAAREPARAAAARDAHAHLYEPRRPQRPEEVAVETASIPVRARDTGAARAVTSAEWRSMAVELDAARGPKPVRVIEQLFMTRYVPLVGALARGEADGAVRGVVDGWSQAFEHSYTDAFSAMRVTGKRPMMTFDAPEIATRIARLNGARSVKLLMVDGMSYDLGERVAAELRARATASGVCVDRMLLWSALPTTTPMQMALLAKGADALRDVEPPSEPEHEIARGRAVGTLRRERTGGRELMKLDLVEARLRTAGPGYEERLDALADEVTSVLSRYLESLPPRTLLFLFGDHGFRLPRSADGRGTGPATQGGASPEEVLVPAYAWLSGGVH